MGTDRIRRLEGAFWNTICVHSNWHRSNEIKTEALSVLSAEQGAEPQLPFGTDDVNIKQTTHGIVVTLPMNTSEDIFGFGLQLQSVNAAGRKRYIKVNSDPKMDTGESHAPVPFYVSTAGYLSLIHI